MVQPPQNKPIVSYFDRMRESDVDFHRLVKMISFHKFFVICVTLVSLLFGIFYLVVSPPRYQSTALVEVEGSNSSVTNLLATLGVSGQGNVAGSNAPPAAVEVALMKSRYILGAVIEQLGLDISSHPRNFPILSRLAVRFHKGDQVANPLFGLSQYAWGGESILVNRLVLPKSLIGRLLLIKASSKSSYVLTVEQTGQVLLKGHVGQLAYSKNRDIEIFVRDMKARAGSEFVVEKDPIGAVVKKFYSLLNVQEQGANTGVLQLSMIALSPSRAQKILNTMLAVVVSKNIDKKSAEAAKTLSFLRNQLPGATKQLTFAENKISRYGAKLGVVDMQSQAQLLLQKMSALEDSLETLKLQKVELLQKFTSKHPFIIALDKKQQQLQTEVNQLEHSIRRLPVNNQKAMNLKRDLEVRGNIYSTLIENMQQLQMLKGGTISDIRVLSSASYPFIAVQSHALVILAASLFLGFVSAVLFLIIRFIFSPNISDPYVLEAELDLAMLAIIPHSETQAKSTKMMKRVKSVDAGLGSPLLLAKDKPKDLAIEALRSLRTSLQMSMLNMDKKILAITGCSPNIGKSFIATNLSVLFSELDKKLILVDADIRRGVLCRQLSIQKSPGLSEYLEGKATEKQIIQPAHVGGFDFISTGHYPAKPAELLERPKLDELLYSLVQKYDLVLIDTPPVLAVTDAAIILKHSIFNILVIGSGKDQLKEIQHAKRMLEKAQVDLSGLVLNNSREQSQSYVYGQYNYYYSYDKA